MRRINQRRLLLYFISGCFAAALVVNALAESQDPVKDPTKRKAIPMVPTPRPNDILSADNNRSMVYSGYWISFDVGHRTNVPLDWCREFGTNCGKPAADAFCHYHGYRTATKFEQAPDIGYTATFTEQKVCNNPSCDGFKTIECMGFATIFESPRVGDNFDPTRVDWCRDWEANCGKPAADHYCQGRGFPRGALRFEIDRHVGQLTATLNGRQTCDGTKRNCDSFKVIECQR